jgi:hypothetical protein
MLVLEEGRHRKQFSRSHHALASPTVYSDPKHHLQQLLIAMTARPHHAGETNLARKLLG